MAKKRKLGTKSESEPTNGAELQQQQQEQEKTQFNEEEEEIVYKQGEEELEDEIEAEDPEVEEEDESLSAGNAPNTADVAATASIPSAANVDGSVDTEEDEEDAEESIQKLIEPFGKDQIIDLLRQAAEKHPDVYECIRKLSDTDPGHRKIFVHGLGWDTNAETLTNVFKKYGEIEDCKAVCDKISGKSKGYGFILFKHRSGARKALEQPQKRIGNRMTSCQLASAGPVPPSAPPAQPVSEYTQRKIYVSNVSADIDPQSLFNFFSKYGEIEEGPLGLDKQTGKPKGFTLFVYKSVESARKALEEPHKKFEGHILHCQKAIDGPKPNKPFHHHHHPHHASGSGQGSHFSRNETPNFMGNNASVMAGAGGHMMAPAAVPYNQGTPQALNPVLGQALTALLATQGGTGLGLTNLLGSLGSAGMGASVSQTVPPVVNNAIQGGYGNQPVGNNISAGMIGGYGSHQVGIQGGYQNPQMGQANPGRSQQGTGHMGGVNPYMGH